MNDMTIPKIINGNALSGIDLDGKEAVVVGRSNIVGKPMTITMLLANTIEAVERSAVFHAAP